MRKRGRFLIVILLLVAPGLACWEQFSPLRYHWRSLQAWLDDYGPGPAGYKPSPQADEAIRHIGPRAVPYVLGLLRATNSPAVAAALAKTLAGQPLTPPPTNGVAKLAVRTESFIETHTSIRFHHVIVPASWKHWQAYLAFQALGPEAKSAVPDLAELAYRPGYPHYANIETLRRVSLMAQLSANDDAYWESGRKRPYSTLISQSSIPMLGDGEIAAWSLARAGEAAVPSLLKLLENDDPQLRCRALEALGMAGSAASSTVPTLIKAMKDDRSREVRWHAADALGWIGSAPEQSIPALLAVVFAPQPQAFGDDPEMAVRCSAAESLGRFRDRASNAIPALLINLENRDYRIRDSAAIALSRISPEVMRNRVLPVYLEKLNDPNETTRNMALIALSQMRDEPDQAIPVLVKSTGDASLMIRANSTGMLGQFGPAATSAIPRLIPLTLDADSDLRERASNALDKIDPRWRERQAGQ